MLMLRFQRFLRTRFVYAFLLAGCMAYGQIPVKPPSPGLSNNNRLGCTAGFRAEFAQPLANSLGWCDDSRYGDPYFANRANNRPAGTISMQELRQPVSKKGRRLIEKARKLLDTGREHDAREQLRQALVEPSAVGYARSILGELNIRNGDLEAAIEHLTTAIRLLPIAPNYANLAYALCLTNRCAEGRRAVEEAVRLDGASPQTLYLLGVILLDYAEREREARHYLIQVRGTVRAANLALAVSYARGGDSESAENELRQFLGTSTQDQFPKWKAWLAELTAVNSEIVTEIPAPAGREVVEGR